MLPSVFVPLTTRLELIYIVTELFVLIAVSVIVTGETICNVPLKLVIVAEVGVEERLARITAPLSAVGIPVLSLQWS